MKASARKNIPSKEARHSPAQSRETKSKHTKSKADDDNTTTSESEEMEASNSVLEAEGEMIIGEQAINTLDSRRQVAPQAPRSNRNNNKRRPPRGPPKNYPFDASLVLNADPPYALGKTSIDSIHLYQMGKKDKAGCYISLEAIQLF